jgi:hypothetical protein
MPRRMFGLLDLSQSGHQLVWGRLLISYFFLLRRSKFLKVSSKWEKYVLLFGDHNSTVPRKSISTQSMQPWLELSCAAGGKPIW